MINKVIFYPPIFLFLTITFIVVFYFVLPEYNVIPFPYNFGGIVFCFAGLFFAAKAFYRFRNHKTNLSIQESSTIVISGVYSVTRNPMYLGMLLLLLGIGICFRNSFSVAAPFLFWLYLEMIVVPKEEKLMFKVFGDQYLNYKKSVRRWI